MASVESTNGRGPRHTVETDSSYRDAERTVDWLADQGFAVEHMSIVGSGLRYVEDVSGRLTTGRSAAQGAMLGLLFSLLFGLFFTDAASFFGVVLYGLVGGTAWGAIWGAVLHYAQRGRRDFGSWSGPSLTGTRCRSTTRWQTRPRACSRRCRERECSRPAVATSRGSSEFFETPLPTTTTRTARRADRSARRPS